MCWSWPTSRRRSATISSGPWNPDRCRTQGLVSVAWHRSYEQFGSMSLHSAFEKLAKRTITESDYLNWWGVKVFSEAALRTNSADLDTIRAFLTSDQFVLLGSRASA